VKKSFFKKFFSTYRESIWARTGDRYDFDRCLGPTIDFFEPDFFLCIFMRPIDLESFKKVVRAVFEKLTLLYPKNDENPHI